MGLFNIFRRPRSNGHSKYTRPDVFVASIDNLLPSLQKLLELHHIRTRLYSLRLSSLKSLFEKCSNTFVNDTKSNLNNLHVIIMDIARHGLFRPVCTSLDDDIQRHYCKVDFANKGCL